MMRFLLFGLVSLFCLTTAVSQTLAPCGTTPHRSEWLANFQKDGIDLTQRPVDFRLQVNAHLLGTDQGATFDYGLMLGSMAALEQDYDSTGIGFVLTLPVDTLLSTEYNSHDSVLDGADMMFANNKADALNIYFLNNPAGNCGYNLPYAGIAIANQCAGVGEKTIAHEVGHALSLPHPFLGWEGGQNDDGSVPADFTQPAPTSVTYDYSYFLDTLIRDTTIIDTAIVELVARTNCYDAADGFCDTPADYIAGRWTCDANMRSAQQQLDPDGVPFFSDGTLIMNYSDDNCQARFSDEQKAAMQAFAQGERSSWVRTTFDTNKVRGLSSLELDATGTTLTSSSLDFTSVQNATHYFVQISERRTFSSILSDSVVTDLYMPLAASEFEPNKTYYARIYAFNDHSFLAGMSQRMEFLVAEGISGTTSTISTISAFPNPVAAGSSLSVPIRSNIDRIQWYDSKGAMLQSHAPTSHDHLEVPSSFSSGIYSLMLLASDGDRYTARIQVIR